jgi:hypothetical protein
MAATHSLSAAEDEPSTLVIVATVGDMVLT